jgi:hypothetical protein
MKRRVTRWVTDDGLRAFMERGDVPAGAPALGVVYRNPITIEYEDGKPEPQPATRERVVEGYAYPYTQGHWGFTSKPDGDGYNDIQPATLYIHEPPKPKCPPHEWGGIACVTCGMPKPAKPAEERIREALAFVDRRRWEEDSPCVRMARILRGEGGR